MVSCGRQPNARVRAQSRKIKGLSRIHPREPPLYCTVGVQWSSSQIQRIESSTLQYPFVRAEIEYVYVFLSLVKSGKDRFDAVLNRDRSIAAIHHPARSRRLGGRQLPIKIDYMTVRVTFSQDRYEAKDICMNSESLRVGLNKALGCQFWYAP